jgi:solute carrier family 13 (sodium-dependent dicarboxylate transporter), member 2/3/5
VLTIAGLASSSWHGLDPAAVVLIGALAITSQSLTGIAFKDALKGVEWNLILFLAATLVMGEALLDSGAARWLADIAVGALSAEILTRPHWVIVLAALIAMLAHLVVTSRSARAMLLIPVVALPLSTPSLQPAALIFLTVIASGFCQTFKVSAKPVALYAKLETPTYSENDLLRLSLWLMPVMLGALVLFAIVIWPAMGFPIYRAS